MIVLHRQLAAIDLAKVPVMTNDRSLPRKARAAMVRELFKKLGLKGISVTTPNYSMAHSVDIRLPREPYDPADYILDGIDYHYQSFADMPPAVPYNVKWRAHSLARHRIAEIIIAAFPAHLDRSDYQSDYFDNPWSID